MLPKTKTVLGRLIGLATNRHNLNDGLASVKKRLAQSVAASLHAVNKPSPLIREIQNGIEITLPTTSTMSVDKLSLDYMWLYNHCRCPQCFNSVTLQKIGDPRAFVNDVKPIQVKMQEQELQLTWSTSHQSTFNFDFLKKYANNHLMPKPEIKRTLWDNTLKRNEFPQVTYSMSEDPDTFASKVLSDILRMGFCLINEVPSTLHDTEVAAKKIVTIQKTYLGQMWNLEVEDDFADTAYTNEGLPPHVDSTYLTDPFGLLLLHCLREASSGGDSFLIDGLRVAEQLKHNHPDYYAFLSTVPIESMYIDKKLGLYYKHSDVILKHDAITNELVQIRFNFTDITPISNIHQSEVRQFYKAYGTLSKLIYDQSNRINFRLKPGTMLVFDNWRLVHGRTPFEGNRLLCGCSFGHSDFLSRCRVLGLLRKDFDVDFKKPISIKQT